MWCWAEYAWVFLFPWAWRTTLQKTPFARTPFSWFLMYKVFREPFRWWTSTWTPAPKSGVSCGPGDGEKHFDPWASGHKGQECPQEIRTKNFMFMLFLLPWEMKMKAWAVDTTTAVWVSTLRWHPVHKHISVISPREKITANSSMPEI